MPPKTKTTPTPKTTPKTTSTPKKGEKGPKAPKPPKSARVADPGKPKTAHTVMIAVAERLGRPRGDVAAVVDGFVAEIKAAMAPDGPGEINVLGLMKLKRVARPATLACTKLDPFNKGEMKDFPARPASTKFRVTPLKGLRELAIA